MNDTPTFETDAMLAADKWLEAEDEIQMSAYARMTELARSLERERNSLAEAIERLEDERVKLRQYPHPDAPGHAHLVRSKWDEGGEPCNWCTAWDNARTVLAAIKGNKS